MKHKHINNTQTQIQQVLTYAANTNKHKNVGQWHIFTYTDTRRPGNNSNINQQTTRNYVLSPNQQRHRNLTFPAKRSNSRTLPGRPMLTQHRTLHQTRDHMYETFQQFHATNLPG